MGSGREKEEVGVREGQYDEVNQHEVTLKWGEPTVAGTPAVLYSCPVTSQPLVS